MVLIKDRDPNPARRGPEDTVFGFNCELSDWECECEDCCGDCLDMFDCVIHCRCEECVDKHVRDIAEGIIEVYAVNFHETLADYTDVGC